MKKEMMSEKESLLEKESRDDGKRVQQCSGSMDTLRIIERFSSILGFSGGILERKRHYFLERFSSILGSEEESRWSMGKFIYLFIYFCFGFYWSMFMCFNVLVVYFFIMLVYSVNISKVVSY